MWEVGWGALGAKGGAQNLFLLHEATARGCWLPILPAWRGAGLQMPAAASSPTAGGGQSCCMGAGHTPPSLSRDWSSSGLMTDPCLLDMRLLSPPPFFIHSNMPISRVCLYCPCVSNVPSGEGYRLHADAYNTQKSTGKWYERLCFCT